MRANHAQNLVKTTVGHQLVRNPLGTWNMPVLKRAGKSEKHSNTLLPPTRPLVQSPDPREHPRARMHADLRPQGRKQMPTPGVAKGGGFRLEVTAHTDQGAGRTCGLCASEMRI